MGKVIKNNMYFGQKHFKFNDQSKPRCGFTKQLKSNTASKLCYPIQIKESTGHTIEMPKKFFFFFHLNGF